MTKKKVLFVLTSHDKLLNGHPTGWYLPEAAHPYYALEPYFKIDWASPKGGKAPLDPSSLDKLKDDHICVQFLDDEKAKQGGYENTKKLSEINPNDYVALFYVGGHGPCFDLPEDEVSIKLAEAIWNQGKILSAICHGPVALVGVKDVDGKSIFAGRRATSFSNEEEAQVKTTDAIPFLVETRLKELGANLEWITALYIPDASYYGQLDFRTLASSQFELLKTLCTLVHTTLLDVLSDLNNTQLVTTRVLLETQIEIQAKVRGQQAQSDALSRINNALKLIELTTRGNQLISAMNTNYVFALYSYMEGQLPLWLVGNTIWYLPVNNQTIRCDCNQYTCSYPAGFYQLADNENPYPRWFVRPQQYNVTDIVPGFVGSCTPLESLLQTTFICLYNATCIAKLIKYFPQLAQVISTIDILNASLPSKYALNTSVSDLLEQVFLEEWKTTVEYDQYFAQCAPKTCSYSYRKRADLIYMITVLLGLYGGLQTSLRFIIPVVVKHFMKRKRRNPSVTTPNLTLRGRKIDQMLLFVSSMKQNIIKFNLFKSMDRSVEAMHRQRIATRLFVILLTGSLLVLLLFTSISKQTNSVTYHQPSYTTYERLQSEYPDTLNCLCSEITQSYSSFVSLHPLFHPICSSVFVTDFWFTQLQYQDPNSQALPINDWRIAALGYFQALAALCQLANSTVNDALRRFGDRSFVSSRLLTNALLQDEFDSTVNEFIYNTKTEFERALNIINLLNQVDQYFSGSITNGYLRISNLTNDGHIEIKFKFNGPSPPSQLDEPCLCAFRPDCQWPMVTYQNGTKIIPANAETLEFLEII
ncbi:unnamed protein product [Rotaria sp. Silwood1]|nr:unnamed protein product [Rotaria sp. Silwood1]